MESTQHVQYSGSDGGGCRRRSFSSARPAHWARTGESASPRPARKAETAVCTQTVCTHSVPRTQHQLQQNTTVTHGAFCDVASASRCLRHVCCVPVSHQGAALTQRIETRDATRDRHPPPTPHNPNRCPNRPRSIPRSQTASPSVHAPDERRVAARSCAVSWRLGPSRTTRGPAL